MRTVTFWLIFFAGVAVAWWARALALRLDLSGLGKDAGIFVGGGTVLIVILGAMIAKKATGGTLMRTRHWDRFTEGSPPERRPHP